MTPRRRIAWIALAGFVAATLLPALYILHLLRRAEASFESHRADIAGWTEDVPVRRSSRPGLLEPAEAGNAWDLLRPALDAVGELYPLDTRADYDQNRDADLDWRGIPGETPELIRRATPSMELCRRAMRRSELEWVGPVDPELPAKAGRMARALCTRAAYAHQEGKDSEAAEWLIVAMGVAQDAARLGQRSAWDVLWVADKWVNEEARLLLTRQDLTPQELAVFGLRLELVLSTRPSFGLQLRVCGARQRLSILEGESYTLRASAPQEFEMVLLDDTVGWRDLFSKTLLRARVLNGIRACVEDLATVDWKAVPAPVEYDRILSRHPEAVAYLAFDTQEAGKEQVALRRRSMFRAAVQFARFQAETGRFPASAQEAGLSSELGHPLHIKEGEIDALSGELDMDLVWTIKRRTKD